MSRIADLACLFCIGVNTKPGTLSQHFVMHVVPPLRRAYMRLVHVYEASVYAAMRLVCMQL